MADGPDIREYLTRTARKHGIDDHIRFNTRVLSADWDSATDTWTVQAERDGDADDVPGPLSVLRHRLLQLRRALLARISRDSSEFSGEVVHPQHWPESLDYAGKRVVVIGSGATAVSMIPSLTEKAGHVTMLQRSPTYMLSTPRINPHGAGAARSCCRAGPVTAWPALYNTIFTVFIYAFATTAPKLSRRLHPRATRYAICPRAILSTCTSSRVTTRGISGCA